MAVIEGVGDEVTLLLGALLVLMVLLLAWASTWTADPPTGFSSEEVPATNTAQDVPSSSVSDPLAEPPHIPKQGEGLRSRGNGQPHSSSSSIGRDEQQNSLVLRLKFLNDTERTATVSPQDTVGDIKRVYFSGQESRVRLIYQGQLLDDDSATVSALHLSHNCVLHCHISQHSSTRLGPGAGAEQVVGVALNVGSLMVPLLMLMLAVLWYCQIQYWQFFTAPATATLAGLTVLISVVAFGVYRR